MQSKSQQTPSFKNTILPLFRSAGNSSPLKYFPTVVASRVVRSCKTFPLPPHALVIDAKEVILPVVSVLTSPSEMKNFECFLETWVLR